MTTIPTTMRAWEVREPGRIAGHPLRLVEKPVPKPEPGEVLVRVLTCGVCRTDLHVAEGDLAVHREQVTPGHEVVVISHNGPWVSVLANTDAKASARRPAPAGIRFRSRTRAVRLNCRAAGQRRKHVDRAHKERLYLLGSTANGCGGCYNFWAY